MEPLWRITLLGRLTLSPFRHAGEGKAEPSETGEIRRFRSQKVAALLAHLALHVGQECSRDVLCEALWPEGDPQTTRNRLRVALSSLRRQLEPPGVPHGAVLDVGVTNAVRLRAESVWVDIVAFETALREGKDGAAHALYAGELLPTFYEDWILEERERLHCLALALSERQKGERTSSPLSPSVGVPAPKETKATSDVPPRPLPRSFPLPLYLTRFFGREAEWARIRSLLADGQRRLITLTGAGGQGKTRLLVEVAHELRERPVWFAALADLWEGKRLGEVIRDTLGLPRTSAPALPQVIAFLQTQAAPLLLLDNLEQIAGAAAPTLTTLLHQVPDLTLLVTSRSRLEIPGEQEVPIPPLLTAEKAVPSITDLAAVASHPAVALFVDRAQSARPDFQLTPQNADDIVAVCCLLEGIPLGLELAAARSAGLTPHKMRQRLGEHWDALPALSRTEKSDRHRSLRAAIEWSVALLPWDQRRLFIQLSVFQGGATLEAIEGVCESPHLLDTLTRLRANSLILLMETGEGFRYSLLETLRQWAAEQPTATEKSALQARHAAYFYRFAGERKEWYPHLSGVSVLEEMEAEIANFRAALAYCQAEDPDLFVDLALALAPFWEHKSHFQEAQKWLEAALLCVSPTNAGGEKRVLLLLALGTNRGRQGDGNAALAWLRDAAAFPPPSDSVQAAIHWAMGRAFWLKGALPEALAQFQKSHCLYEAQNDHAQTASMRSNIGVVLRDSGDYAGARAAFAAAIEGARKQDAPRTLATALDNFASLLHVLGEEGAEDLYWECLALKRALGMPDGVAITLSNLATLYCRQKNWTEGRRLTEEVCLLFSQTGNQRGQAVALNRLGQIADVEGKPDEARRHFAESLRLRLALGNPHGIVIALITFAGHAFSRQEVVKAAQILGAVKKYLEEEGVLLPVDEEAEYQQQRAAIQEALSPKAFAKACREGASWAMTDLPQKLQ